MNTLHFLWCAFLLIKATNEMKVMVEP